MVQIAGGQEKYKLVVTVHGDQTDGPEKEQVEFAPYDTVERAEEIGSLFRKRGLETSVVTVYTCGSAQALLRSLTSPAVAPAPPVQAREEPTASTPDEPRVPEPRKPGEGEETPSIDDLMKELEGETTEEPAQVDDPMDLRTEEEAEFVVDLGEAYDAAVAENTDRLAVQLGSQEIADQAGETPDSTETPKPSPRRARKTAAAKKTVDA
jgi:hypothetical protein